MARPIPLDAPLTSATRPSSSGTADVLLDLLDVLGSADGDGGQAPVDALDEAREHAARADLDEGPNAAPGERLDGLREAHRRGELPHEDRRDAPRRLETARHGREERPNGLDEA